MERIRFIVHRGQKILLIDCSNCSADEVGFLADQVPSFLDNEPAKSALLLADFSNSTITREAMERVKIAAVHNSQHLKRSAWVITGNMAKTLHRSVQTFSTREIPTFYTRDDALNYLLSDEQPKQVAGTGT
jgi:hypothetical protein